MSEWRTIYQRFVQLKKEWSVHEHPGVNDQLFHTAVLSKRSDAQVEREFASFGLINPPAVQMRQAHALRSALEFPSHGRHPDDPCEDVYQAALTMMPFGEWTASPSLEKFYRGQRDARWRVVPSFFRESRDKQAATISRVNAIAKEIAASRPDLRLEQTLALIQHYSKELAAPTWLIDLTWDPKVALFFASDGGRTGDVGMVTMLVRREWEGFAAGGRNRLGSIRVIDVPGILRIERQRALFLDTSHPDLLDQYVAHSVWFRQVDGLTFEDLDAEWPVSRSRCYPELDPTLEEINKLVAAEDEDVLSEPALAPASDASEALGAADYLAIAQTWCEQENVMLEPVYAEALQRVCLVHSRLQEHRDHLSIVLRSLHRLQEATEMVQQAQQRQQEIDLRRAMRFILQRSMTETERELIEALVTEAESEVPRVMTDLLTFISKVLADLPPYHAELVVIGAADASDERVARDIELFMDDQRFRVFDLRGAQDVRGIGALSVDIGDAVRLLLVDNNTATSWLDRLTRAFLDRKDRINFKEGLVERPEGRSIVIIWYGATNIADLPPLLREPIVQFVK